MIASFCDKHLSCYIYEMGALPSNDDSVTDRCGEELISRE